MQIGIATTKGKNGHYVSIVGTTSSDCTTFHSTVLKLNGGSLPENFASKTFEQFAKKYYQKKLGAPDVIIVYREGLNEKQIINQIKSCEIPVLKSLISVISKKFKIDGYNPQWCIVSANKKISSRFFE